MDDPPKERNANAVFRKELTQKAEYSLAARKDVIERCTNDLLFWINSFCWLYEPRDVAELPWITYPYQDPALLKLAECIGKTDVLVEKSRDMGASWMCLAVLCWQWQFMPFRSFALISRSWELVDKPASPDALFWKLDFLLKKQPRWLVPEYARTRGMLVNKYQQSTMTGYATTEHALLGGRRTAAMVDEFAAFKYAQGHGALAATQFATDCRIFNSTYLEALGAFYEQSVRSDIVKIRMSWWEHPKKNGGLYYDDNGKARSPWYDKQCERLQNDSRIATELDIDPARAGGSFFPGDLLQRTKALHVLPPFQIGRLIDGRWVDDPKGPVRLWIKLGGNEAPPKEDGYTAGADVASGTGATPSSLAIISCRLFCKVCEYSNARCPPHEFAKDAVALCRWFHDAYLGWEAPGPGRTFGDQVMLMGYRSIYWRTNEASAIRRPTDVPGWWPAPENQRAILEELRRAMTAEYTERSAFMVEDAAHYVYAIQGNIQHKSMKMMNDPSGAAVNHGDRVVATAIAWKLLKDTTVLPNLEAPKEAGSEPEEGTLSWRRWYFEEQKKKQEQW